MTGHYKSVIIGNVTNVIAMTLDPIQEYIYVASDNFDGLICTDFNGFQASTVPIEPHLKVKALAIDKTSLYIITGYVIRI